MNTLKSLGTSLLLLALSIPAFSQELWQGAETGMSIEQIQEKFPSVVGPSKPDPRYAVSLTIPDYKIDLYNFEVKFILNDNGLDRIVMNKITGSTPVVFNSMQKLLKLKYGEPLDSSSNVYGKNISWLSNGTTITLLQFKDKLHILYKDNVAETDRL